MKYAIVNKFAIVTLAGLTVVSSFAQVENINNPAVTPSEQQSQPSELSRLEGEVGLSAEQQGQVAALLMHLKEKRRAVRNDASLTREALEAKLKFINEEFINKVKVLMPLDQYEKWERFQEARRVARRAAEETAVQSKTERDVGTAPWENGNLKVSDNGRYLQQANGKPFFWQGDTAWLLFQKMDRDEVKQYFTNRKAKGFNVVQCIFLQSWNDVNVYADTAFADKDISKPKVTPGADPQDLEQYDFWDHADYTLEVAAQNGIYLAITPVWGHFVRREPVTTELAEKFAANLAEHFKNKPNVIWINGGSTQGDVKLEIWDTIGNTIKKYDPQHLMTFHTFGRTQSSTWFNDSPWLDVNMFTSGHRRYDQDDSAKKYGEDNWRYVLEDLVLTPRKPTLDGEPSYDATPQGLHDLTQPYWIADDCRRYAYWSVFAGACGHTYGHNSVRQVYKHSDTKPASGAKEYIQEALDAPASSQMQHLKNLILSRPFLDRVNGQSAVAGDKGEKYDRVLVTKGSDYLMAYTYTGRKFAIQMGSISGSEVNSWWFNPRTGEATNFGIHKNTGTVAFDPPGEQANGNDWVLVLDDATKKFLSPGVIEHENQ